MKEFIINLLKAAFILEIDNYFEVKDEEITVILMDGTKTKIMTKNLS